MKDQPTSNSVVIELCGIAPPACFPSLRSALTATWGAMRLLPLDAASRAGFELILARPRSVDYITERLAQESTVSLTFILPDGPHLLRISRNRRAHSAR
ncbi:hypothetical protein [Kitasatospora sp. LaBMicrA B282]|uniref:hypothetical protein n=1 Tax=Kitasatospora sp. LaBMicrA B282 TaxID=3420949 RepID=UPI003D1142C1